MSDSDSASRPPDGGAGGELPNPDVEATSSPADSASAVETEEWTAPVAERVPFIPSPPPPRRTFHRVVNVVEIVALALAAATVIGLFINTADTSGKSVGEQVFVANCARCHGPTGEGGRGPRLSGGAVSEAFPNRVDQIALVSEGRGGMPAFGETLTVGEISAVVDYTRDRLRNK